MAVVISAMAPSYSRSLTLHGSSRLSRASSGAMPPPPLAKKDAQDTLFTVQSLMSGQCELVSFSENDLRSSTSPLLSLQLQAQQLCRDEDDACARFQETPPSSFALVDDLEAAPISDEGIERLAPLCSDEENQVLYAAPAPQQASMQFSEPRSDDQQAGKKRMSSPPWPSCIADDDEEEEAGPPPSLALPSPPLPKKARTQMKRSARREHGPPTLPPTPPPIKKAARFHTKSRSNREQHAAARAARLRKWHNKIATRILTRQFWAPELSRGRTALRCQCPELALEPRGLGCCALHRDTLPEDMAWMYSADQGHGAPPLVGGPGVVLVPSMSARSGKTTVLQYARWRRSVSLPTRFYVQRAVEKGMLAQQQRQPNDNWRTMPEY